MFIFKFHHFCLKATSDFILSRVFCIISFTNYDNECTILTVILFAVIFAVLKFFRHEDKIMSFFLKNILHKKI